MATDVSNADDLIDSRDVIARIEELKDQKETADGLDDDSDWTEDDAAELQALLQLAEDAEGYAEDWAHGVTLIRDSHFEAYAQELAEEIGAIDRNAAWPLYCIDWERAARDLKMDYTSVEFDGVTFWVR